MSIHKDDSNGAIQRLSDEDINTEVFRDASTVSDGVLRRRFGVNGSPDEKHLEDPQIRRIGRGVEGQEDNAENLGPLRAFPVSEVRRVSPRNRSSSSDVEYVDDNDGGSSVCSENVYSSSSSSRDFLSLPCDAASKWSTWEGHSRIRTRERESLLESLEKQRRESVESRLKELRIPNKRNSLSSSLSTSEMPIIAKSNPMKNATLPRQMRRTSYQSVIVTPFFAAKPGPSASKPLLPSQLGHQEMRERRGSFVSPNVQRLSASARETNSFPLRSAGSLSCIDDFVSPRENAVSAKPMRRLPSELKLGNSDETVDSTEILNSSFSTRIQALISDHWPDASLENGCLNNYSAQGLKKLPDQSHDSFSNRNIQILDQNGATSAVDVGDASETEVDVSSSKSDSSAVVSSNVHSVTEAILPVKPIRPSAVETMEAVESEEQFRGDGVSDTDMPLNGTHPVIKEFCSDKYSHSFASDNDDKHYQTRNSVTPSSQSPASRIEETCREDKARLVSPAVCIQTPVTREETLLLSDHRPERGARTWSTNNATFDLDAYNNMPKSNMPPHRDHSDSAKQNDVLVSQRASAMFCSDIQIQIKEVDPVFPASFRHASRNGVCNGESRVDSRKESAQTCIDDELEEVTPNWSSYPGPLPDGFRSSDPDDSDITLKPVKEVSVAIDVPDRSVSTLKINLQPRSSVERETVSKQKTSQKDEYDDSYNSKKREVSTVGLLSSGADTNVDFLSPVGFNDRRKRITVENVAREIDVLGIPPKSVERNEKFVKQDASPATPRILTLPRDYQSRSWNRLDSRTRGLATPQQELSNSPEQELADVGAGTPRDLSVDVTPSKAHVTRISFYAKKDEQRTAFRNGERTRSSFEAMGGVSTPNDRWQAMVMRREDRWKDSSLPAESSRSPEKTPSVDRIWETLEEPRTRLTKRNLRLESDSKVVGSKTEERPPQYLRRSLVTGSGGIGEAKVDAVVRSISLQDPVAERGAVKESLLEIEVLKGGLGLGFCIEGGKDGPYGDRPLTVKRLFRGSSDPKFSSGAEDSLRAGDEILTANGRDMTLLSRFVAWNFLKTLPEGTIKLVIRRQTQQTQQPDTK